MPQRGRVAKVTTPMCVWTATVGAAIEGQHPIRIVTCERLPDHDFDLGAGAAGCCDAFTQ